MSSPLQTTTVGIASSNSSSSLPGARSSKNRGTTNSNSQVHFSHRLSMQGTQHRAASGDEGVVYACGTRFRRPVSRPPKTPQHNTYKWIGITGQNELEAIRRVSQAVGDVYDERGKFCLGALVCRTWSLWFWRRGCETCWLTTTEKGPRNAPSSLNDEPPLEWPDRSSRTSAGIAIANSPSSHSCNAEYILRFSSG